MEQLENLVALRKSEVPVLPPKKYLEKHPSGPSKLQKNKKKNHNPSKISIF
jgi:hypothetical protein